MNYNTCLKEMYALRRFGIKLGLSTIEHILSELDNPHKKFASIHIAGTNGKGSVAAMLANVLKCSGFRVGLYTSPHLIRFNERIVIDGTPIDDHQVASLYQAVKKVQKPDRELTFFEYTTAMAFQAFAEQQVDWAIIETGMGGRLDATNVLTPKATIITTIGLEHQAYLGKKICDIAYEKAGIIKPYCPVITDVRHPNAIKTIIDRAHEQFAPLYQLGQNIRIRHSKKGFSYCGLKYDWRHLHCALNGQHQIRNAALALCAYECTVDKHATWQAVDEGLRTVTWPGRMEIISQDPLIIIDGAHNFMAIKQLSVYLKSTLKGRPLTLVLGVLDDKPYEKMLMPLLKLSESLIITQPKIDRGMDAKILYDFAKPHVKNVRIVKNVADAYLEATQNAKPSDAICITGSLYVVGEAKAALSEKTDEIFLA
ncbi:MAG: bifunctional folylpolyglutamate synthase/dihydrofolate synthase [Candidatus Magnetomorum sp.]|nr:bifunctional folylpolyglutamate synthase/dihydrofolate synthase [Candidatus Magnetomorum sp.]